ncbi:dihydropteroate synthase, partial [Mangrovactinospora gilvigrisea]|uniref:dihydropteroate synthase n=1 Tax=Mangrovactinospora gilvigrisea TaxID=1428644 RepID=UPI000ACB5BDA
MRAHPVPDAAVTPRRAPLGLPALDRTAVMGVVNVTPDSFSDGGRWFAADTAIAHGRALAA